MDKGEDPYKILGVAKDATAADIKKAYRKLALKYHPDRCDPDDKVSHDLFAKVNAANEILSDETKRLLYAADQRAKEEKANQASAKRSSTTSTASTSTSSAQQPRRASTTSVPTRPSTSSSYPSSSSSSYPSSSSSSYPSVPSSSRKEATGRPQTSSSTTSRPTSSSYSMNNSSHSNTSYSSSKPQREDIGSRPAWRAAPTPAKKPETSSYSQSYTNNKTYASSSLPKATPITAKKATTSKSKPISSGSSVASNSSYSYVPKTKEVVRPAGKKADRRYSTGNTPTAAPKKSFSLFGGGKPKPKPVKTGVKSTKSTSKDVKHASGRIETITTTVKEFHDGRSITSQSSTFKNAPSNGRKGDPPAKKATEKRGLFQ